MMRKTLLSYDEGNNQAMMRDAVSNYNEENRCKLQ